MSMLSILKEVIAESKRVEEKLGYERNYPSLNPNIPEKTLPKLISAFYGLLSEEEAKRRCDFQFILYPEQRNWAVVAVEELVEVIEAPDDIKRREELIQLGQVIFSWIEYLDQKANERS